MTGKAGAPQPAQVERCLAGIRYPARKEDIVRQARDNHAPKDIMDVLGEVPDRQYADAVGFAKGLGKVEHGLGNRH